jgi:hypothetical protein
MGLDDVRGLAAQVLSARNVEEFDAAMTPLRQLLPGCVVTYTAAWGLILIARLHAGFTAKDLFDVSRMLAFDNIVLKAEDGSYEVTFGLISADEAKTIDLSCFTSGEAVGASRWSSL